MARLFGIERRRVVIAGYALAAWIGAALLIGVPLKLLGPHPRALFSPLGWALLAAALTGLAAIWTIPFLLRVRRTEDEYMRAGSRFGWYWGGSFGLLASLPAYVFVANAGLRWLWPVAFQWGLAPGHALQLGYLLPVVFQVLGSLVAMSWWRWRGVGRSAP